MKFSTIIEKNNPNPAIYHGIVLSEDINTGSFEFGFRSNGKNYIWSCQTDYWMLVK